MRIRFAVLLVTLAAALFPAWASPGPAQASCVGPMLEVEPRTAFVRGEPVSVTGGPYMDGCNDTGSCTAFLGCQSCDYGPPAQPLKDVSLELRQRGRTWELATSDADADGSVTWSVTLPADARPGAARLVAEGTQSVRVRVR